ncbi:MAG: UDP-N-acetylmuramoyl-L-alanyl-D-glutamate--2,6-diaminopimelate ligase [Aerococcaceae bacterium]|nr:UDP-N-acetylmuramoyl-L-alanyl-D-glutamate--2,6-diaminopimelate ligase [Aerococcaceae bacterium]
MLATKIIELLADAQLYGKKLEGVMSALVNDSRQVVQNSCFIAIKGTQFDGHHAMADIAKKGASVMMVEYLPEGWQNEPTLTFVKVPSTFRAQAILANAFYQEPTKQLNVVAITGTNGKTTTSTLISQLLMALSRKTGVIGTLHYKVDQTYYPAVNTTPNALVLQGLFAEMVEAQCQDAIIEASSHALALGRLWYTDIDCAIFTNLTREHLDFHKTMDEYAYAKSLLFAQLGQQFHQGRPRLAIINADDPYANKMMQATAADILTYSIQKEATVYATDLRAHDGKQTFCLHYQQRMYEVTIPMVGAYNVSNYLAAFLCLASYYGFTADVILEATEQLTGVEGRMQRIDEGQNFNVVVDFAHTPDAIKRVLSELKQQAPGRLVTITGHSGGNRDSGARPEIGDYVFEFSDDIIFTADNPRHEPFEKICQELIGSHNEKPYILIEDREEAVAYAIQHAKAGDTLLFAGKGGELYQIIGDEKLYYDEIATIRHYLKTK